MKYIFILYTLFSCFIGYTQPEILNYNDKYKEFDYYAIPSTTSDLAKYFKRNINTDLLKAIKFNNKNDFQKRIFLRFSFLNNNIVNLEVDSRYSELNDMFIEAFKKYDIEKLNIKDKSPLNIYFLQLVSWENNKAILNCSQHVIIDKLPVFKGCESIANYAAMKECINKTLENHITKNISVDEIIKARIIGKLNIYPKFLIDKEGVISRVKVRAKTRDLMGELNRVVASFPKPIKPPMRNGNPTSLFYRGSATLFVNGKGEKGDSYKKKVVKSKASNLNVSGTNDLALHFKKYLNDKELQRIPFQKNRKTIGIGFSIDKKGRAIEIKSSSYKDENSNDKLISIFKKFPIEQLNINSEDVLERYSFIILTRFGDKTIIQCSNVPLVLKLPVFKGCKKSKTPDGLMKCLQEKIVAQIVRKFNTNIRNKTKLTGIIKMNCSFTIDTDGTIIKVKVKAPNPYLANEIERVIKDLPKVVFPAYRNGEAIEESFSIPIKFRA